MSFATRRVFQLALCHLDKSIKAGNEHHCAKCGAILNGDGGAAFHGIYNDAVTVVAFCRACNLVLTGDQINRIGEECVDRGQYTIAMPWKAGRRLLQQAMEHRVRVPS